MEGGLKLNAMANSKDPDERARAQSIKAQLKAASLPGAINVDNALP